MIKSRKDLREYLEADKAQLGRPYHLFKKWLINAEDYYLRLFMVTLRYFEYYSNKKRNLWDYIPYLYYHRKFHRLQQKTGLYIGPNTVGAGFCPLHPGFVRIGHYVRIGKNCTVLPMVLIGKRRSGPCTITIGDDCYIGTGVTILGPLTIGNNVSIAAGAVVLSDVPDNAVVAGVPAKVVKIKANTK